MKTFAILILPAFSIFSSSAISAQNILNDSSKLYIVDSRNSINLKSFIVPTTFIAYGFTALGNTPSRQLNKSLSYEVKEDMPGFKTTVDNYLKYAPMVATYALNIVGVKAKHPLLERTAILAVSNIVTNQIVTSLKHATHQMRPDGSTYNSFPSGHTATAFVGAEFMHQELGWHSPWYSFAGYTMATATGILRIANNRHWLGDVIAGAGIGMLTTKLTYLVAEKIEKKFSPKQKLTY